MLDLVIPVICAFVVGMLAGIVIAVEFHALTKNKTPSQSTDANDKTADLSRVINFAKSTEQELSCISRETHNLAGDISELCRTNEAVHPSPAQNRTVSQGGIDIPVYEGQQAAVQQKPVQANVVQQKQVQANTVQQKPVQANTVQQRPAQQQASAPAQSSSNAKTGVEMRQVFDLVESLQKQTPEYRMYNTMSGKVEYTTDPHSDYILYVLNGKKFLFPNRISTFSNTQIHDATYQCSIEYIGAKNTMMPCVVDDDGNVAEKGRIL